jgi:4-hydroxybenzoate-CoA ligase
VLLRMTNSVEFAASFLALVWIGGVPVLQNSLFGTGELEHIAGLTAPVGILTAVDQPDDISRQLTGSVWRADVDAEGLAGSAHAVERAKGEWPALYDARRDDPAFIVFTSGTTGRPKGIVHAHRWLEALGDSNRARIPVQENDVALATGEWSFVSALGHNLLFPLRNGIVASILEERASPDRILAVVARDGVTLLYSVATLYRRILGQAGIETRFDVSSLRGVNATGEPLEASARDEWSRRFGCPLWEHFGISEAQMVLGHGPLIPHREGTVGVAWGAKPAILDGALKPQPAGTVGRLGFAADYPGFFLRYIGDKAQTKASMVDGWYLTSDLATIDADGYVAILGRADDCFKSKGVLIVPREIEDALGALETFEETCVFPIPDSEIGYRIGVAIVLRSGTERPDRAGLAASLSGTIAPFKFPQEVFVVKQLPKNSNGKTQRSAVRDAVEVDGHIER